MKVKKMLSVVLSMVVVASCTLIGASAAVREEYFHGTGRAHVETTANGGSAYTYYAPGSLGIKRYVKATLYYTDSTGALQNVSRQKSIYIDNPQVDVSFSGYSNIYSMTSVHIIDTETKTLSIY